MPSDPGIGVGIGGLLTSALNPGLASRVAQHLTPNPLPLAQQGGPAAPGSVDSVGNPSPSAPPPGSNLPPPAATQSDPVNAAYISDLMKYQRQSALAADFNRNIEGMAAGFGTAQQQASKQAALARGGGVGDGIGDLVNMQRMQDQTIQDNEHARFMGNMAVFAQSLSQALGRPVSVAEATEAANNPDVLKMYTGAGGANMQTPDKLKEADAEARAWADAHPDATPQEIAQHKSDFLAQTAGGLSGVGKELAEARRNWHNQNPGKSDAEMVATDPSLKDEISYVAIKGEQAKTTAAAGQARQDATETLPALEPKYQDAVRITNWLQAHPAATAAAVHWGSASGGVVGQGVRTLTGDAVLNEDTLTARGYLDQLNDVNFAQGMQNVKNVRSVTEANKLGSSAANLDKRANSDQTITSEVDRLANIARTAHANVLAAAGKQIPAKYTGLADPNYLTKGTPMYNGATEEKVDFSHMTEPEADAAYHRLDPGTVYTDTDGKPKRKPWNATD